VSFTDPDGWHQPRRRSNLKLYLVLLLLWLLYTLAKSLGWSRL
jgi:hypothetical protein